MALLVIGFDKQVQVVAIDTPREAAAGPDRVALVSDKVMLDGSASSDADGDTLTFHWSPTQLPKGSDATATLIGAETANPSFVKRQWLA